MSNKFFCNKSRIFLASGAMTAILILAMPSPTEAQSNGVNENALIPPLMLPYGSGWSGGGGRGNGYEVPAEDFLPADYLNGAEHIQAALDRGIELSQVRNYLKLNISGRYIPPANGIGPITDDPDMPYLSNSMQRGIGTPSTVRVAGLEDEAAKNLLPWALDALKAQNELVLQGKNTQPRHARCWELGIPALNELRHPLYIIQTPEEVVMYTGKYTRHIYMNVPHSKNLEPSWYGESVGHYEGDTLVVSTIGQNDKTFVDMWRTPHTDQIRVIERFRVISSGKGLETSFTVEDPGAYHKPWSARRMRYLVVDYPLRETDRICAAGNEDYFNEGLEPMQRAEIPDF